jgi:hypothetical protein
VPYSQPSLSGAVPDCVGHQLVNGQDHVADPLFRKAGPAGVSLHRAAQGEHGAGVERLIKGEVTGHGQGPGSLAAGRSSRAAHIGYRR